MCGFHSFLEEQTGLQGFHEAEAEMEKVEKVSMITRRRNELGTAMFCAL